MGVSVILGAIAVFVLIASFIIIKIRRREVKKDQEKVERPNHSSNRDW
jgi:hypothetical protein